MATATSDDSFAAFFSRPIRIAVFNWEQNTALNAVFDPWTLFFSSPRVINRINNFNLLSARLCVKFLVNGNTFYYGRLGAFYTPLQTVDDFDNLTGTLQEELILETQKPHIYIDPTNSEAGELCLPFVWYNNALSIPRAEWAEMGAIRLRTMNLLKHANGADGGVDVTVLAWAEDVNLSIPTSANSAALTPQMGLDEEPEVVAVIPKLAEAKTRMDLSRSVLELTTEMVILLTELNAISSQLREDAISEALPTHTYRLRIQNAVSSCRVLLQEYLRTPQMGDEFGTGPISTPATVVAKAAGSLSSAPVIGPYMMATQMIAKTTAQVAKLFGFSRPTEISNLEFYTPRYVGDLATTSRPDTTCTLATEPKQAVTVDPQVVGVGTADEMTINSIAQREGFLTTFPWSQDANADDLLFQVDVTPMLWDTTPNPGNQQPSIYMTPSAFASLPFNNWQGSMDFHFQVIASGFHRGRIKIVYDPQQFDSDEYNTAFTRIVDLAHEKDVTIRVGWGIPEPFLEIAQPGNSGAGGSVPPFSATPFLGIRNMFNNGVLRVYVVNELTTPNSLVDNSIEVNVYAKCGDDCKWLNPRPALTEYSYGNTPQAGVEGEQQMTEVPYLSGLENYIFRSLASGGSVTHSDVYNLPRHIDRGDISDSEIEFLLGDFRNYIEIRLQCDGRDLYANATMRLFEAVIADMAQIGTAQTIAKHPQFWECVLQWYARKFAHTYRKRTPQSGEGVESEQQQEHVAPMKETVEDRFAGVADLSDYEKVFFGEKIVSFRSLLKRYCFQGTYSLLSVPGAPRANQLTQNAYPALPGFQPGGIYNGTLNGSSGPYNPTQNTLMTYLTPAYVARRGSIRYKSVFSASTDARLQLMQVTRSATGASYESTSVNINSGTTVLSDRSYRQLYRNGFGGMQATHGTQNPVLEFEVPYQTPVRFSFARKRNYTTDNFGENAFLLETVVSTSTDVRANSIVNYVAAGEDFSLSFYIGPPVIYFTPDVPTLA